MNYSSRFFLYAPLGLFLSLALGVGIHWWVVASAFSDRLAAWNGHEIVPGVTLRMPRAAFPVFPSAWTRCSKTFHCALKRRAEPRSGTANISLCTR